MKKEIKENLVTYAIFLIIAIVGLFYGRAIAAQYEFIRVWDFANIVLLLIGVPFLFFQYKARLPDFWQRDVRNKKRILYPLLTGIFFGILDILVFKIIQHPQPYATLPPFLQPFPYSLFLYFSGALEVEVFYRLIPMTIILFIGNRYKGGKYYKHSFWFGALLTSLREPLEQLPDGSLLLILYSFGTGFLMNFIQALWYKRSGFLASLFVRLGHYLLWHILLGMYVQYFELMK
jgi:hypothetical protein